MSFRQDSRKGKDAPKMTVRDMRLFMAVSAHEKLEQQQESMADDYEGSRSKTPTKRNSAARKSTGKVDIYQKEENDRNQRVKKRLKKMREKKSNFVRNWKTHGVLRNTLPANSWSTYSPYIGKIQNYEGFETSDAPPLYRLYPGQEHRDRFVRCHVCEKPINSTEDFFQTDIGLCMHRVCVRSFQ
jgi:hypothetical protein